jgi:hypothetical protein
MNQNYDEGSHDFAQRCRKFSIIRKQGKCRLCSKTDWQNCDSVLCMRKGGLPLTNYKDPALHTCQGNCVQNREYIREIHLNSTRC